jgi:hypothetical protein
VLLGAEPTISTLPRSNVEMLDAMPLIPFVVLLLSFGAQSRQGNASQLEGFGRHPVKLVTLLLPLLLLSPIFMSGDPAKAAVSAERCGIGAACTALCSNRLLHY